MSATHQKNPSRKFRSKADIAIAEKLGHDGEQKRAVFQRSHPDDYQRIVACVQRDQDEAWRSPHFLKLLNSTD